MGIDLLKGLALYIVLLLVQVLVFNHIHLFGCATPLLYIYIMLLFCRNSPKWLILVCGFLSGLLIDIFSNTPGLASASMVLVGLLQPYILVLFLPRDSAEDLLPSMHSLGTGAFISYAAILVFVFCLTFFSLETFNFFNWLQWLMSVVGSSILTFILLITVENMRRD